MRKVKPQSDLPLVTTLRKAGKSTQSKLHLSIALLSLCLFGESANRLVSTCSDQICLAAMFRAQQNAFDDSVGK